MSIANSPYISVIIPVHNVAHYVERCARSLFEQTITNLELIFVDDCTPDNSVEIIQRVLNEYPHRFSTTHIIRKSRNGGLASARHTGILKATGKYIAHCDSDDWVDVNLYKTMYEAAVSSDADIVICGEKHEYPNNTKTVETTIKAGSGKEILKNWYRDTVGMFCHDKLIRRSLYIDNNILPWEGLNMWEDNGLITRLMYFSKKLVSVKGVYYHYNRCNQNAMTSSYGEYQVRQMIGIAKNLTSFFKSQADFHEFENTTLAFQYLAKLNLITDSFKRYKEFKIIFPQSNKITRYIPYAAFSLKGKIRFFLVKNHLAIIFISLFKFKNFLNRL